MDPSTEPISEKVDVIDVSKVQPKNVPSLTCQECIKNIWKKDPLICPECLHTMVNVSFIVEPKIIQKILNYLDLWKEILSREPPVQPKNSRRNYLCTCRGYCLGAARKSRSFRLVVPELKQCFEECCHLSKNPEKTIKCPITDTEFRF